jgi:hypothetical protein
MYSRSNLPRLAAGVAALTFCALARANGLFPLQTFPALNSPSAVVLADVNGDGKLDAVQIGADHLVAVMLGKGNGVLKSPLEYYVTDTGPESFAVGDLNGDGKPDIVTANTGANDVSVLIGKGDGTFAAQTEAEFVTGNGTAAPTYATGTSPISVTIADVNGDGKPDLVVSNYTDDTVGILLGKGDGTFRTQTTTAVGAAPDFVSVADLNGDGKPDLVVSNAADDTLSILLGNGDGTFQAQSVIRIGAITVTATTMMAVVADVNNDGKPDIVGTNTNSNSGTVQYLPGNGDGSFGPVRYLSTGLQTRYIQLLDVNGDGDLDLVSGSFNDGTLSVRFGHGDGSFAAATVYPAPGISSGLLLQPFAMGDLDGDGKPEMVAINPSGSFLQVFGNDGSGRFHPPHTTALGRIPAAVVSADLNGDHHADLVEANSADGTVSVLLGNGDGTLQPAQTYSVGSHPQRLLLADMNGDGKLDLLVGNFGDGTVGVMLGNGDGTFQSMHAYPAGSNLVDIAVADMDQDGKLDLVAANAVVNQVSILHGNGNGSFRAPVSILAGTVIDALAVADVNRDGYPDVVAVGSNVAVLKNDGHGALLPIVLNKQGASVNLYTGTGVRVLLRSVTDDNQPEILVADYSNSQLLVYIGNRLGFFGPAVTYPTCANPNDLAVADMNQDGNLDVVVSCVGASAVDVMLGNGKGAFTATPYSVELDPRAVAIADFDEDGQKDLAVVNGGSDTLNLLLAKTGVIAADHAPVATSSHVSIADGKNPLDGQMLASDKDGDSLSFGVVANAAFGSVAYSASNGSFEYLAGFNADGTGYHGPDSFEFQVSDGVKLSNTATVHIIVATNSASATGGGGGGGGGFGLPALALLLPFLRRRRPERA